MPEEIIERVSKLEIKVEDHSKQLEKQQEKNDIQTELNTLLKMQVETSKEQNRTLQKFESTLVKVNENLTHLNSKQELLDERVTGIEDSISKQSFSLIDVVKYAGATLIGIGIAFIYKKLGL